MSVFVTLLKMCKIGQTLLQSLMDVWNWEMRYDLGDTEWNSIELTELKMSI